MTTPTTHTDALSGLHNAGGHFVLAHDDKSPVWQRWQKRRPGLDLILAHDGPVGLIPWSLRQSALDVDEGDPSALLADHPARVAIPSRRDGGTHLYYDDDTPRHNADFSYRGVSGQVRGANGYLIVWNAIALWTSFFVSGRHAFPSDLFSWAGVVVEDAPTQEPLIAVAQTPQDGAQIDLSTILPGTATRPYST